MFLSCKAHTHTHTRVHTPADSSSKLSVNHIHAAVTSLPVPAGSAGRPAGAGDPAEDAADAGRGGAEEHLGRGGPGGPQADPGPEGRLGLPAVRLHPV